MQNYLSRKLKTTTNSGLSSDRHIYLSLEQAEPNLGYPREKSSNIPLSENYYKLITIDGANLMDRYWVTESPAKLVNGLSIYDENVLVGTASSVSKLNFNGDFIQTTVTGSISTITFGPTVGNNGKVVFVDGSGSFSLSDKLLFNPSAGILTVNNRFDVGIGGTIFTVKNYNVGINTANPTARLHVNGNVRIDGTLETENILSTGISTFATLSVTTQLKDSNNSPGTLGQVLASTGVGVSWTNSGVSGDWTDNTAIRTHSVTYTNTTGSLLYVSATPGIDRDAEGLSQTQIAGSYTIAEVDGIEVARARDNGTANANFIYLNTKFFVPTGSNYIVKVYDSIGNQWISSITTYSWSEFQFGL